MNRREFIRELVASGCFLKRHGKRHDLYANPKIGRLAPVPRHSEIKESLCQLNSLGSEKGKVQLPVVYSRSLTQSGPGMAQVTQRGTHAEMGTG